MLTEQARANYETILDAAVLKQRHPQRPAIIFYHDQNRFQSFSQTEFVNEVAVWRTRLAAAGICSGDLVAIAHGQRPETVFAFWGALQLGAIPSLFAPLTEKLDPDIYFSRLRKLIEFAQPHTLLVSAGLEHALGVVSCQVLPLETFKNQTSPAKDKVILTVGTPHPTSIALLQHSSGTTGLQKGVALTHEAILNQIASLNDALHLTNDEVVVSWLPLYHDMGLMAGFLLPLIQGLPLVLLDPLEWARRPVALLEAITHFRGSRCWLPNFAYNHLARRVRRGSLAGIELSSMKQFINCSEPVRSASHALFLEKFERLGVKPTMLGASYAMAENTFAITQTAPDREALTIFIDKLLLGNENKVHELSPTHLHATPVVSSGRPLRHAEIQVVNKSGQRLGPGWAGEIWLRSNCLLEGYYQRPDLFPFAEGWYRTGDIGFVHRGELFVIGRQKEIIIHAGKNIFPQDLEAIVNNIPGLAPGRCTAFGVFDAKEGTELITILAEPDPREQLELETQTALKKEIRQQVGRQTQVTVAYAEIVPPRWLIKTSSGKIARAANREKWLKEKPAKVPN